MKYFLSVQVHATFATMSSEDRWLYMEFPHIRNAKPVKAFIETLRKNFQKFRMGDVYKSHLDGGITIYYCEDETFSNVRSPFFSAKETPEFKKLVSKYFTYCLTEKRPDAIKKHFDNETKREYAKRKKEGYVYSFPYEDYSRDKIQGGLSDEVFNSKSIADYTQTYPHGYIGHSVRKPELDSYIEKKFMKIKRPMYMGVPNLTDLFVLWLSSTDGRHFGDSLEGYGFATQKKKVREHLNYMYNCAFVWNLKEHDGSWDSTTKLMEKYKHRLIA